MLSISQRASELSNLPGTIPMRELVYRVQPLPERMLHLVWDFGQLDEKTESFYITEMVQKGVCSK